MQLKLDMNNHIDSVLMCALTLYLYAANKYIVPSLIEVQIAPVILKILNDGVIGFFVLLSAVSTGALNAFKFWLMYRDKKKKAKKQTPITQQKKDKS